MKLVSVTDIEMEYRLKGGNQFLYVGMRICSHGELCMPTLSEKKRKKNSNILGFLGMNLNLQYKIIYFIK